jgi:phage virion morphogenesis protein
MAGASVSVRAEGFSWVDLLVSRLLNLDFNPLFDGIGALVEAQTKERVKSTKTAPDGTKWPELSPAYEQRKKKGGGILELEGDLRDSLVHLVSGASVEVGTNLAYAATHQFGDARRGIPQREFLGLSPEDEQQISGLINVWWQQQLAG